MIQVASIYLILGICFYCFRKNRVDKIKSKLMESQDVFSSKFIDIVILLYAVLFWFPVLIFKSIPVLLGFSKDKLK
jgi:hypothetical protein